eukprot:655427-Pyramimonas_sp.AAC.1
MSYSQPLRNALLQCSEDRWQLGVVTLLIAAGYLYGRRNLFAQGACKGANTTRKTSGVNVSPESTRHTMYHSHEVPEPGRVLTRDYRSDDTQQSKLSAVKVLTWNIERGYKLEGIIHDLLEIDADIIALQEVDIGCERSRFVDCGDAIAKALGLNYVFVT